MFDCLFVSFGVGGGGGGGEKGKEGGADSPKKTLSFFVGAAVIGSGLSLYQESVLSGEKKKEKTTRTDDGEDELVFAPIPGPSLSSPPLSLSLSVSRSLAFARPG